MKKIGLVCTTIGKGEFLADYCKQVEVEGLKDNVTFYIIRDTKEYATLHDNLAKALTKNFKIKCLGVPQQWKFLTKLNFDLVPYNSDNRRNVGYLQALEDGCEVIISIDDDNLVIVGKDFFKEHAKVGQTVRLRERESTNGWYNVCSDLGLDLYPRGYPYKRHLSNGFKAKDVVKYTVVNQGLWLCDPDLDAVTWIAHPATKSNPLREVEPYLIGPKTWLPINSQNTSVAREAMVANYFIPMGYSINGMKIDHHADIFTGYFLEACVKHMTHGIRIGTPLVNHVRNNHDYMDDLVKEYACMLILEDLTEWLPDVKLDGISYSDCYLSLASQMEDQAEKFSNKIWTLEAKSFIHRTAYCMREWVKTIKRIGL